MNLNIGWLYPDLMSTYGDRGNILALVYRAEKRRIKVKIIRISVNEEAELINRADLIFMGGAQDKQQEIVNKDLQTSKGSYLKQAVNDNVPGLYVCGAYQFLGRYYKAADGTIINGLNIFDLYTASPGLNSPRLIGNLIVSSFPYSDTEIAGFENHTGRTYLGKNSVAFADVVKGFGNNGEDKKEGVIYKNSIGTYLHGPVLPKNPRLADWLISKALERKYQKKIKLSKLNDDIEDKARNFVLKRERGIFNLSGFNI